MPKIIPHPARIIRLQRAEADSFVISFGICEYQLQKAHISNWDFTVPSHNISASVCQVEHTLKLISAHPGLSITPGTGDLLFKTSICVILAPC